MKHSWSLLSFRICHSSCLYLEDSMDLGNLNALGLNALMGLLAVLFAVDITKRNKNSSFSGKITGLVKNKACLIWACQKRCKSTVCFTQSKILWSFIKISLICNVLLLWQIDTWFSWWLSARVRWLFPCLTERLRCVWERD